MNSKNAVGKLGRDFVFLNVIGNVERPFPASPHAFVAAELGIGDSRRGGPLSFQRQHASADRPPWVVSGSSGKLRRGPKFVVRRIQRHRVKIRSDGQNGKWKG